MLTREKLAELYRALQDELVLSIYLDGEESDPAKRNVWRKELDHQVDLIRKRLESSSNQERAAFEKSLARLTGEVAGFAAFVPGPGWVGFATPGKTWYAKTVPVPMPHLVRWEDGIRVAPYVRALKQNRAVVATLLDSRSARIFQYRGGTLSKTTDLQADTFLGDLTDMNISKRASTHSGTRGKTGADAAQRFLEVGAERMLKELVRVLSELVGDEGLLVLGGTPEMVAAAAQAIPKNLRARTAERPSMHAEMSAAEVKAAVEEAASRLNKDLQGKLVTEVMDLARAGGRGCLGREETVRALQERRVDTLLLSRSFIRHDPDFADFCVGRAFDQQAQVEELSNPAEERLQREADGIAARLRYRIREAMAETALEGEGAA